jgi:hypothetical protein
LAKYIVGIQKHSFLIIGDYKKRNIGSIDGGIKKC